MILESFFRFNATGALGSAGITLGSASVTGDGAVTGILDVCPGGSFPGNTPVGCPGGSLSAVAFAVDGLSELTSTLLVASGFFDIFVDLTVDGGLAGTAALASANVTLTRDTAAIPEPGAFWALGSGLVLLGSLCRRSKHKLPFERNKA